MGYVELATHCLCLHLAVGSWDPPGPGCRVDEWGQKPGCCGQRGGLLPGKQANLQDERLPEVLVTGSSSSVEHTGELMVRTLCFSQSTFPEPWREGSHLQQSP